MLVVTFHRLIACVQRLNDRWHICICGIVPELSARFPRSFKELQYVGAKSTYQEYHPVTRAPEAERGDAWCVIEATNISYVCMLPYWLPRLLMAGLFFFHCSTLQFIHQLLTPRIRSSAPVIILTLCTLITFANSSKLTQYQGQVQTVTSLICWQSYNEPEAAQREKRGTHWEGVRTQRISSASNRGFRDPRFEGGSVVNGEKST